MPLEDSTIDKVNGINNDFSFSNEQTYFRKMKRRLFHYRNWYYNTTESYIQYTDFLIN